MIRKYHWVSFFLVTGVSQRSHRPSTTCSLASTVWSFGHQLTCDGLAVGQAALEHPQEQPLVPAVVLRVAGVQHAVPVERAGVAAHRRLLRRDVLVGPRRRVGAALDGGVLRGQAEGVPADRVQHVEAALHPVARDDVAQRVRLGVTHVQVARRVREHVEHVLAAAARRRARRCGTAPARPRPAATSPGRRARRTAPPPPRRRGRSCRSGSSWSSSVAVVPDTKKPLAQEGQPHRPAPARPRRPTGRRARLGPGSARPGKEQRGPHEIRVAHLL